MNSIHTDRLIMRKMELADSENFFALNADADVVRYLGIQPMEKVEQAEERVKLVLDQYEKYGIGRYAVIEKASGEFIGFGGLKYFEHAADNYDNIYDLGYVLAKSAWGKGYASEISRGWIDHGFNQMSLSEIYGMTDPENEASKQVLLKAGMHYLEEIIFEDMPTSLFKIKKPVTL